MNLLALSSTVFHEALHARQIQLSHCQAILLHSQIHEWSADVTELISEDLASGKDATLDADGQSEKSRSLAYSRYLVSEQRKKSLRAFAQFVRVCIR